MTAIAHDGFAITLVLIWLIISGVIWLIGRIRSRQR